MRKWIVLCLVISMMSFFASPVQAIESNKENLNLDSESVVLLDAVSGTVLYQKNAFDKQYPASITKIMTVYLALTKGSLDQTLVASKTAIDNIDRSSSHIWLDYNEEIRLEDAVYATFLQSANDTANVLAEGISGTQEAFAQLMSETAIEAGAMGTNFTNAHGLPDENHYTTAYDMAVITRYALQNEQFKSVFETIRHTMNPTNKQKDQRIFATGNEMLKKGEFFYEYATGGKVGWTEDAGYTMVVTAEKDGLELIAVVMNSDSKEDRYEDAKKLFDYGFNNYKTALVKASDYQPETYQIMKGKKVAADCTFTMEHDFRVLLESDDIADLLKVEYEIRNKESAETIECYAVLTMGGMRMGEQKMKAEIIVHDLSFKATVLPKIMMVVDGIAVGVFVVFTGLFVLAAILGLKNKKVH